jgi:hypothetical protein
MARKSELVQVFNFDEYEFRNKKTGKTAKLRVPRKLKKIAKQHWFPGRKSKYGRLEYSASGSCDGATFTLTPVLD